jgi:pimeloyl-ACP methyl ester carboxylesterase
MIHYLSEGEGLPLVFLHGLGGNASNWLYQRNYFKNRYQVISVDLPGHGKSLDLVECPFSHYQEEVLHVLDERGISAAVICGISMGGKVALDFACHHPDRVQGLVLSDTFAALDEKTERERKALFDLLQTPSELENWLERVVLEMGFDPGSPLAKGFEKGMENINRSFIHQLFIQLLNYDQRQLLASIQVPTLIFHGEKDDFIPFSCAQEFCEKIKNARMMVIPDSGHLPNVEKPKIFNEYLEKFLENIV